MTSMYCWVFPLALFFPSIRGTDYRTVYWSSSHAFDCSKTILGTGFGPACKMALSHISVLIQHLPPSPESRFLLTQALEVDPCHPRGRTGVSSWFPVQSYSAPTIADVWGDESANTILSAPQILKIKQNSLLKVSKTTMFLLPNQAYVITYDPKIF